MPYVVTGLGLLVIVLLVIGWRLQRRLRRLSAVVAGLHEELRTHRLEHAPESTSALTRAEDGRVDDPAVQEAPVVITALGHEPEPAPIRRVAAVSFGAPLIKVAALSYALWHAFDEETRMRASITMRRELKRQRRMHRKAHRASRRFSAERQSGWTP